MACGQAVGILVGAEHVALPEGVVGVLHPQGRPLQGVRARAPGTVGGAEVPAERGEGPAVRDDVVEDEQQDVAVGARTQQVGADTDVTAEVEGHRGQAAHRLLGPDVGVHSGRAVLGDEGDERGGDRRAEDLLAGRPVVLGEDGAQALVPGDHVGQGTAQGVRVQGAL